MSSTEAQVSRGKVLPVKGGDALASGMEGYAASMKRYPVLGRQETEAALSVLRSGKSINELRTHTLFAAHLAKEARDLLHPSVYHAAPVRSYRQLFADSPTIGHLVAFGNFPTIYYWVRQFQTTYAGLPLELEEFLQHALFRIVPDAAQSYTPLPGSSFKSYISNLLQWRLDSVVDACIVERSMLPRGGYRKELKPKHDGRRRYIESLDAPFPEETDNGEVVSLYEQVEQTQVAAPGEHLERMDAIRRVYRLAGITPKQAQVLQTCVLEGEDQTSKEYIDQSG